MWVCYCRAVTDRTVRAAIEAGATTPDRLAESCGAGARCGGCTPALERLLAEYGLGDPAHLGRRESAA